MILLSQILPDILDVEKTPDISSKYFLVDPTSRRELAFVKGANLITGEVEYYKTVQCDADDPECVKFDHSPIKRKFAEFVVDKDHVLRCPTYKKFRDFDVVERLSGAIVKQVRI